MVVIQLKRVTHANNAAVQMNCNLCTLVLYWQPGTRRGFESKLIIFIANGAKHYNHHEPHEPIRELEICALHTQRTTAI